MVGEATIDKTGTSGDGGSEIPHHQFLRDDDDGDPRHMDAVISEMERHFKRGEALPSGDGARLAGELALHGEARQVAAMHVADLIGIRELPLLQRVGNWAALN